MGPNFIALAIPFFFVLIAIELGLARRAGRRVYRLADAIADLGCGITQRISLLFFEALLLAAYVALYQRWHLVDLGAHPVAAWVLGFLGVDFTYYWWHRTSHRLNFMWAAHVVHHQSEDYNFAVALRQGVLTPVTSLPFGLPLALAGVPPLVYVGASALSTLYQFWIHTELAGKLGPLEHVLNTPSHHRVHHARNARYLDRNYGAVLIIWDRLFGSYAPEQERPAFGITRPLRSFNPLWAEVQPVAELAAMARRAPSWRERIAVWLAPPERKFAWWRADVAGVAAAVAGESAGADPRAPTMAAAKFDVAPVSRGVRAYVLGSFALAVAATFLLMLWGHRLPRPALAGGAALVLMAVLTAAGLLEARRWARPAEAARLVITVAAVVTWALAYA